MVEEVLKRCSSITNEQENTMVEHQIDNVDVTTVDKGVDVANNKESAPI